MPTLKSFIDSKLEEFEKGCNTDNISDPPSDQEWIKEFISQALSDQAKLIEAMVVPEKKNRQFPLAERLEERIYDCDVVAFNDCRQEVIDKFKQYLNE